MNILKIVLKNHVFYITDYWPALRRTLSRLSAVLVLGFAMTACVGGGSTGQDNTTTSSSSTMVVSASSSSASSRSSALSSSSTQSVAGACDLPSTFSWISTQVLIAPQAKNHVSIKDPTIVYYNNLYHVFATVFDTDRNSWSSVYLNFSDFSRAGTAPQISMATKPTGDTVAPQVFFFRPQNKWYLIYQWGAKYSTNTDIANPDTWTSPHALLSNGPSNGLDYWVICDDNNCHLFFSNDDGKLYHSKTTIDNFPNFSGYDIVMTDEVGKLFEASNVYKVQGTNKYLLLVEAYGPRYFRSWTSTSLDGPWTPLASTQASPFAGAANVTFEGAPWTNDISHGEMIRSGVDETLTIDPCHLQYLYQGMAIGSSGDYGLLPWRLALLTAK